MSTRLSHTPADIIRWLLIDLGVGTEPEDEGDWPIYAGNEPNLPDPLIIVYDTSGITQGRIQRTGETVEHHGIQFQIRGVDYPTTWTKADELRQVIDEQVKYSKLTVDDSKYTIHAITRQSGPIALGKEQGTHRFLFTLNAIVSLCET